MAGDCHAIPEVLVLQSISLAMGYILGMKNILFWFMGYKLDLDQLPV
jgi:hypothetical protein